MLRRFRRPAVAIGAALLIPALAACGSSSSDNKATDSSSSSAASGSSSSGLSQVSFTGDVGKGITASWKDTIPAPTTTTATTLVKGTGAAVKSGDTVNAYVWIGDGTTKKQAYSDYTNGKTEPLQVGGSLGPVFTKIFAGATYGSRIAAVTTPIDLLGQANSGSQLGISDSDSVVVVVDLISKQAAAPTPTDDKAHTAPASKEPKVIVKNGKPTGFDWKGVAKPALTTPVQRTIVKQGTGAVVKSSDTVTVNYLGETYQAKTPFDESYSKQAFTSALSGLIPGWTTGLTGLKVGTRVILQIPPAAGYGSEGSGAIPPNATLWFVIDIVKATS